MPHKTFVIEKLLGEATNQLSRMTNQPTRVVGRFDRLGGIGPIPDITSGAYDSAGRSFANLGYDNVGLSVFQGQDGTTDWFNIHYIGSGLSNSYVGAGAGTPAYEVFNSNNIFYVPGGGLFGITYDASNYNPNIAGAIYVKKDGFFNGVASPISSLNVSQSGTGGWVTGEEVYVLAIYFDRTPFGWMPIGMEIDAQTIAGTPEVNIDFTAAIPSEYLINLYVAGFQSGPNVIHGWQNIYSGSYDNFIPVTISAPADIITDAQPYLYGAEVKVGGNYIYPEQYTYAKQRGFYVNGGTTAWKIEPVKWSTDIAITPVTEYTGQHVMFTDEGHLAFSHTLNAEPVPNFLRFDSEIKAIAPGVRGVYALSVTNMYEAYGDFETGTNTRVENIPMLVGVDDTHYSVATSNDGVYFAKGQIIHKVSTGGVQQIGRPKHAPGTTAPSALYYDQVDRRLFVRFDQELHFYDPTTNQWGRIPGTYSLGGTQQDCVVQLKEGNFFFNGYELTEGTSVSNMSIEFSKLDLKQPSRRKRIHRIIMDYEGQYSSFAVSIREHGSTTWQACTVINRGDSVEVRCPTVVATAFDVKVDITPSDAQFVLNPPIIFTYEVRGTNYDRY